MSAWLLESTVRRFGTATLVVLMAIAALAQRPQGERELRLAAVTPLDFFGAPAGVVSPDGQRIAFSEWEGEQLRRVYVLDSLGQARASTQPRLLTPGSGGRSAPAWSPEGTALVFADDAPGRRGLWVVDVASGHERRLLRADSSSALGPRVPMQPGWSFDGTRVWFAVREPNEFELWSVAADGSGARREAERGGAWPASSPDGRRVAVIASESGAQVLRLIERASGGTRDLSRSLRYGRFGGPAWSRDGRTVFVSAAAAGDSLLGLWSVDVVSGRATRVLSPGIAGDVLRPTVTSTGEVVVAVTAGGPHVAVMPLAAGPMATLGSGSDPPAFLPAFAPGGRSVAATAGSWDGSLSPPHGTSGCSRSPQPGAMAATPRVFSSPRKGRTTALSGRGMDAGSRFTPIEATRTTSMRVGQRGDRW